MYSGSPDDGPHLRTPPAVTAQPRTPLPASRRCLALFAGLQSVPVSTSVLAPGPRARTQPRACGLLSCAAVAAYTPSALLGRRTAQPQDRGPHPRHQGTPVALPTEPMGTRARFPLQASGTTCAGPGAPLLFDGGCSVLLGDLPVHSVSQARRGSPELSWDSLLISCSPVSSLGSYWSLLPSRQTGAGSAEPSCLETT